MSLQTDCITGINAVVSNFQTSGFVEIEHTTDSGKIETSAGEGGIDRVAGNVDFTGRIMAFGYKPPHGAFPNQNFSLGFTQNGTDLVSCSSVKCIGLEVMVPAHDKSGRNAMFYVVHFGADGEDLAFASVGGPSPGSTVAKFPSKGLAPYLSSGTSFNREVYSQWQHLMITAEIERKVNSDSGGVYFRAAGELDWSFTYEREVNTMGLLPSLNRIAAIRMQTNPSVSGGADSGAGSVGYWLLQYGIVDQRKGKIDHASRLPVAFDVTLKKCNNGTTGFIIADPDGVQMFPTYNG